MGAGVEPGGFELTADLREGLTGVVVDDDRAAVDHAIHVEHAKADAFHVKRTNRDAERGAFVQEGVARGSRRLRLDRGHERLEVLFGGQSGIGGSHKKMSGNGCTKMVI